MTRGITNMVKGLGIGMAVGAAAGALRAVGDIVDNMQYMVK